MRVLTYCEHLGYAETAELLALWQSNWASLGWKPQVLGGRDARPHPLFGWLSSVVCSLPTKNDRRYEDACWLRWLALANVVQPGEVVVFTDYDVHNRDFRPEEAATLVVPGRPVNLDAKGFSGPFVFDTASAQATPVFVGTQAKALRSTMANTPHLSDMMVWMSQFYEERGWTVSKPLSHVYEPGKQFRLTHIDYSSSVARGTTKVTVWNQLEKQR